MPELTWACADQPWVGPATCPIRIVAGPQNGGSPVIGYEVWSGGRGWRADDIFPRPGVRSWPLLHSRIPLGMVCIAMVSASVVLIPVSRSLWVSRPGRVVLRSLGFTTMPGVISGFHPALAACPCTLGLCYTPKQSKPAQRTKIEFLSTLLSRTKIFKMLLWFWSEAWY